MKLRLIAALAAVLPTLPSAVSGADAPYAWQQNFSRALPTGELEYTPQPFAYAPGAVRRYIDFEGGNDANSGETPDRPWKHHPWDRAAGGNAKAFAPAQPVTYVFKRGAIYRGRLLVPENAAGTAEESIQLTSDPQWGKGEAVLCGTERVTGFTRGAHPRMTDAANVWKVDLDFAPRTLWLVQPDGAWQRLRLARDPNWQESEPNDVMSEWPTWEQPEWWKNQLIFTVDGKKRHKVVDTKRLTRPAEDYVGATVWTEWGIVMGSPYPAQIEAFDEKERAGAIRGPWTFDMLEKIITGNRYYLEDMPWMLDEPGEFWFEKKGDGGTLYVRLPGDADPNGAVIEAGKRLNMVEATRLEHVRIAGLTFRGTNVHWDYNVPRWAHPDLMNGAIRWSGSGGNVEIANCVFADVSMALRAGTRTVADRIGTVVVRDNAIRDTDHGALAVTSSFSGEGAAGTLAAEPFAGRVGHVDVLRNKLERIGWRILSGEHGHAVNIEFPLTSHMAGNHLHRIAGWGLAVFGGKPSGNSENIRALDVPLSRHVIQQNRVEDVLLKSNDWGGIETWQGGPFYVFDNLVINALGFKNWTFRPGDPKSAGSFGHAYYLDGSFKNYLFNNIGAGRNNELGTKGVNITALQGIFSFENWFFHNTWFRFAEATRQQEPSAGRARYLGNVLEDVSRFVFRHTDPKDVAPDPNASHYQQGGSFAYPTLAYANNVLSLVEGQVGAFEETGVTYDKAPEFAAALGRVKAQVPDLGVTSEVSVLKDPARGDFRPAAGGAAVGRGAGVFVPWGLFSVAGEWSFTRNNADPTEIIDEHWNMTPAYGDRAAYVKTRRYPLAGTNITAESFVAGPLNTWTPASALQLNGRDQWLTLPQSRLEVTPPPDATKTDESQTIEVDWATIEVPAKLAPGKEADVVIALKQPLASGEHLRVDLHWLKKQEFGGFNVAGGAATPVEGRPNTYRIAIKPVRRPGLANFQVLAYRTPSDWEARTHLGRATVPVAPAGEDATTADLRTVDISTGNFLLELFFQTKAESGTLVRKMDQAGYELALDGGRLRLSLSDGKGETVSLRGDERVNDGTWRHVIAEVDRQRGITFYLDGKRVSHAPSRPPAGSLANPADFLVGGGPELPKTAMTLAFLRVSRGTLEDARTSIGELYAWQFDGPQYRDFAGADRRKASAAGALVAP